ncbi:12715_t:CDS:10, partial [Entrophospora sp. SA101]
SSAHRKLPLSEIIMSLYRFKFSYVGRAFVVIPGNFIRFSLSTSKELHCKNLSHAFSNASKSLIQSSLADIPEITANSSQTYIKLSPIEHVLKRPDTYVGSVETVTEKQWIYNAEKDKLEYKEINYVPAFLKIFDEILVNAADNKMRDPSMNQISVNIDKDDGQISVYNNGKGIPIEIHKELNVYVPEMLFGQLMTSSNYNDDEKKFTGGRNGLGAKSANIFSTKFTVETIDMAKKKQYVQSFYENMTKTDEPKITAYDKKEEYTKISFNPDFEKLGMSKLTNDTIALLNKRVYDIAGTVKNVKVFLNDKQIQTKNFKEYVQMYLKSINVTDGEPSKTDVVHQQFGDHWEVSIAPSIEGQFQQVSFVNSICTSKGGTHVNHVIDQIVTKLIECIEKKNKDLKVKHFQIKNHIWVFVNCLIENPAFDSQTKEIMTLKHHSFRPKCRIDDNFIKKGYDYLMGMTCWTFSKEEINKYEEKKKILRDEFAVISGMSAKELWIKDLDALENAWDKFLQCNSLDVDKENRMKFPANIVIAIQDITNPMNLKKAERDICCSSSGVLNDEKILLKKILRANYPSILSSSNSNNKTSQQPDLRQLIEVLLATNLTTDNTFEKDLLELLLSGCQTINCTDEQLTSKFSKIIFNFTSKRMIHLNDNDSFGVYPLKIILPFLIKGYSHATQSSQIVDILRALSQILYENGVNCQEFHEQLLQILLPLANQENPNLETRRMAINGLGNLCFRSGNKLKGKYKNIYQILFTNLTLDRYDLTMDSNTALLKIISSTFRALQFVVNEDKNVLSEPFNETIDVIKKYVYFNFVEGKNQRKFNGRSSTNRHSRTISIGHSWLSSDSEISDGEYANSRKRNEDSRIRLNALGYLQSIGKASQKLLYPYWHKFFPNILSSSTLEPSLISLVAYEPIQTVRISACSTITAMIDGSKNYLLAADDRESKSSFTPLSIKLGVIVREIHSGLLQIISTETRPIVLVQLLKCCNVLINNVAYDRLSSGYISRIYYSTVKFLNHEDLDQPASVRIEGWGILCAFARTHFSIISPLWKNINQLIVKDLVSEDLNTKTASMTFLVEYAKALSSTDGINNNVTEKEEREEDIGKEGKELSEIRTFCTEVMLKFSKDESSSVKAAACRCLGVLVMFPCLNQDLKFISDMVTIIIRHISDTNLMVKIRSSWALGNLCDTMVLSRKSNDKNNNLDNFLTNEMCNKIVKAGLSATNDKEKVRINGVRILGSIINVGSSEFLKKEENSLVKEAVLSLIKNFETGSLKKSNEWSNQLYESLIRVVMKSENFKVRINACLALSVPATKEKYDSDGDGIEGKMYIKIFDAIVSSLENIDNLAGTGFGEVKYQEQLKNQLIATYQHLISFSEQDDDQKIINSFIERYNKWSNDRKK